MKPMAMSVRIASGASRDGPGGAKVANRTVATSNIVKRSGAMREREANMRELLGLATGLGNAGHSAFA